MSEIIFSLFHSVKERSSAELLQAWLSALARNKGGFCESYRRLNSSTCIWTIWNENPSGYLTIFFCPLCLNMFSPKASHITIDRLQSTMDAHYSFDFVLRLINIHSHAMETYFKITKHGSMHTESRLLHGKRCMMYDAGWRHDARSVNGTRSIIAHDTPFVFKTAWCTVFKRNWCTLLGIIGNCCSHQRKNAT